MQRKLEAKATSDAKREKQEAVRLKGRELRGSGCGVGRRTIREGD